jgi:hypothetical protein
MDAGITTTMMMLNYYHIMKMNYLPHHFRSINLHIGWYFYQRPFSHYGTICECSVYKIHFQSGYRRHPSWTHVGTRNDYQNQLTDFGQFRKLKNES